MYKIHTFRSCISFQLESTFLHHTLLSDPGLGWLCFQFVSAGSAATAMTSASHVKPFELNLRYLGQIIYRSGKMYWMTFPWPRPKVTAVASISKNLLVCPIKWEPLIRSLQNVFFKVKHYFDMKWKGSALVGCFKVRVWNTLISEMGWPIDMERNGCESSIHDHDID